MRPFAVIDAETDPFKYGRIPRPFLWGFFDGENYLEFESTDDLVRHLWDLDAVVYAHNGGRFDHHFLFDYVDTGQDVLIINGRVAKIKLGKCELRDSWNILPVPLADHDKGEIDYSIFEAGEREKPHNKKKISIYLQRDCTSLYNLIAAFRARHGARITQASASMALWESIRGGQVPRSDGAFFAQFRPFYYGGRVECFKRGVAKGDFEVYDINSAYPRAMLDKHPADLAPIAELLDVREAARYPASFWTLDCVSAGAFPWRVEVGRKLTFPNDGERRTYHVTGWEVAAAFELGLIRDIAVRRVYCFDTLADFREYILPLYAERQACKAAGDKAGDILAKLAMNGLYGKFGADPDHYTRARLFERGALKDLIGEGAVVPGKVGRWFAGGQLGPHLVGLRELEDYEKRYYNVATAASITGYVRAFLLRSLHQVRDPIYCDTDSIAARDGSALAQSSELGDWKREALCNKYAIAGRKLYAFWRRPDCPAYSKEPVKIASKGAKLSADDILAIASGREVEYSFDAPTFSVRRGQTFTRRKIRTI